MYRIHPSIMGLLGPMAAQSPSPTEAEMPYTAPWDRSLWGLWSSQAFCNGKLENASLILRLQPLLRHE